MRSRNLLILLCLSLLIGCSQPAPVATPAQPGTITAPSPIGEANPAVTTVAASPDAGSAATRTTSPTSSSRTPVGGQATVDEPASTPDPQAWMKMPVISGISPRVAEIFAFGLQLGNNPRAFSKVGDCGSTPTWFLGDFDRGERFYSLGKYTELEGVIAYYAGSFDRISLAARSGFNTSSVLTPLWANRSECNAEESPLACEYRRHKPAIAFITLGANDVYHLENFEAEMRKVIEYSLEVGVIPVLATKPDNIEGDHAVNAALARLATEYQVPLWNYWLAVQDLPNHGLQEDGAHITWASNHFDDPLAMQSGWTIRNLTALQVLDALWRALELDRAASN